MFNRKNLKYKYYKLNSMRKIKKKLNFLETTVLSDVNNN